MNHVRRMALPAPASALSEEGDAYVASLVVEIACGGETVETTGDLFEELVTAMGMRGLAFRPRTRALLANDVRAGGLSAVIDRAWSGIDSFDQGRGTLTALAEEVRRIAANGERVAWRQAN